MFVKLISVGPEFSLRQQVMSGSDMMHLNILLLSQSTDGKFINIVLNMCYVRENTFKKIKNDTSTL